MDEHRESVRGIAQRGIEAYLNDQARQDLLRFITCGSVDDGKSTLIGRLLYEAKCLFEDQVNALHSDSIRFGTQAGEIDFALLVDGLSAEREQGITIDVAYRFFKTDKRSFIVADTPGHEQYTRNMATGASTADAAVLLIDARQGVLPQTRRHAYIVSLLGVESVIVVINKMDLVDYKQTVFNQICVALEEVWSGLELPSPLVIPVSALRGDGVVTLSSLLPWYDGQTLLSALESAPRKQRTLEHPFRMFVQWVNRPHLDFRGVSGTINSGKVSVGDEISVLPSGQRAKVSELITMDASLSSAQSDQALTIVFDREIDASRGDMICSASAPAEVADHFSAHIVWMSEAQGLCGRSYLFKLGALTVSASLTEIKYSVDVETYKDQPCAALELNDIARIHIKLDQSIPFESYRDCESLGSFILIDKRTFSTLAAGMIQHPLRRATNIYRHDHSIKRQSRQQLNGHRGVVLWFTGLSGSGKSTLADHVERILHAQGVRTYLLDGDNVRHGLNRDLGFTPSDRVENIRRIAEVAKLMVDAGLVVLTAFISPYRDDRAQARNLFANGEFQEIYVSTPLAIAEARDPKGLYKKARAGLIPNFTGIGSPYEPPYAPEFTIDTSEGTPEDSAEFIFETLANVLKLGSEG